VGWRHFKRGYLFDVCCNVYQWRVVVDAVTLETYRCDFCNDGVECVLIAEFADTGRPKFCPYDGEKKGEWHLQGLMQ
jgi:hypothetical protein